MSIMKMNDMQESGIIRIDNFGPIRKAELILKPLTIIIGANNSGKSFAMLAIHSILRSMNLLLRFNLLQDRFSYHMESKVKHLNFINEDEKKELQSQILGLAKSNDSIIIPRQIISRIVDYLSANLQNIFEHELERLFGLKGSNLVKHNTRSFNIQAVMGKSMIKISQENGVCAANFTLSSKPQMKLSRQNGKCTFIASNEFGTSEYIPTGISFDMLQKSMLLLEVTLTGAVINHLISSKFENGHFLPAGRSGILQAYIGLTELMISHFPLLRFRNVRGLSGVIADFISTLITLGSQRSSLYRIANEFEKECQLGEIELGKNMGKIRSIEYQIHDEKVPLISASSTVTELAPLILYTKYLLKKNSVLVIEEPESHLHPANQRRVAKFIVQLVRNGVNVVLSTHSDLIINQISLYIQANKLSDKQRKKLGYHDASLAPNAVSAHLATVDADQGNIIHPIAVDEQGIDQDEFVHIQKEIFTDTVILEDELDK